MPQIVKIPFGRNGHLSTRIIFGAAAFFAMSQEKADQILKILLRYGINHIDVAASYGDAELRIGSWMPEYRQHFFLATKTDARTADKAAESIQHSLKRLQTDHIDLIQFHNLVNEDEWQTTMRQGGALEAALEAKEKGWVRHIGVTGHGIKTPEMHLRSLQRFDFDSVLLPYSYMMMQDKKYAEDFRNLLKLCRRRKVAVQTIKSIARRRWPEDNTDRRFSWYEPIKDPEILTRTVHWVLSQPDIFLNTSSDASLLPLILEAATRFDENPFDIEEKKMADDAGALSMTPIFAEGMADTF